MMSPRLLVTLSLALLGAAPGCAPPNSVPPSTPTAPQAPTSPDPQPPAEPPPSRELPPGPDSPGPNTSPGPDARVDAAKATLSASLGVDPSAIALVSVENLQWSNGAIGCPKPDMAYTQAIVPGYRIVLEHDGKRYDFHGRDEGDPFLCE